MTRAIDERSERYVLDSCALDPLLATAIGVPGHDHELPDLSPDGFAAREELDKQAIRDLAALHAVDAREELARDAFLERVGLRVELADAQLKRSELSVIEGAPHWIQEALTLMSCDSEEAAATLAGRLAGVPRVLGDYRRTLHEEAARGRVVARRQYVETAALIRGWTRPGSDFFAGLVATPYDAIPDTLRAQLSSAAAAASDAYTDLAGFLEREMAPLGREHDGVGREHYALASRYFLGASVDLDATYAWGWDELARIERDMAEMADRIVPGGSIEQAAAALDADPARNLASRADFRAWMQERSDEVIDRFHGVHFDIPEPIRTLDCKVAPTNDGGAWYIPPTEDFSRPGTMWFSFTDSQTRFATWQELTTVYHEGVPGHHLQCAQAVHNADQLNRWQRLMCWISGHGEGWALYAERLMDELGFFADPGERLGFLDSQSFRAARVVVDIGVHLGLAIPANPWNWRVGETWDAARALEFMLAHTRMDESQIRFEVNRYLGWPGQAPSYKVGEKIWLEAREDASRRPGFDLKAFHTRALDLGSVPLDLLFQSTL
ncbi:MAG: DUF885 domain-containing protein [Nocardioides sp.]|uniref:DUF885 domain-containing protein n=1 Tax=Nocardioides sp. TaxID=35761 RepID=UPI0039E27EFA